MREMKPEQEDSREIKDELQLPEEEKPGFWGDSLADSGETDTDEKAEAAYYEARRQERHERILLRRKRRKRNRILGSVLAILVLFTCGGILFRKDIGKQFGRIRTAVTNGIKTTGNKNSTDNKKDIDVAAVTGITPTPEVTEEATPTQSRIQRQLQRQSESSRYWLRQRTVQFSMTMTRRSAFFRMMLLTEAALICNRLLQVISRQRMPVWHGALSR